MAKKQTKRTAGVGGLTEKTVTRVRGKPFVKGLDPRRRIDGMRKGTKHFKTIFMEELLREVELKGMGKMPSGKAMSIAMIRKAISGDVYAFNAVADRVDGKPKQEVEGTMDLTISKILDELDNADKT